MRLADSDTHALDLVCRFLLEPGDRVLSTIPISDDEQVFSFIADAVA